MKRITFVLPLFLALLCPLLMSEKKKEDAEKKRKVNDLVHKYSGNQTEEEKKADEE